MELPKAASAALLLKSNWLGRDWQELLWNWLDIVSFPSQESLLYSRSAARIYVRMYLHVVAVHNIV